MILNGRNILVGKSLVRTEIWWFIAHCIWCSLRENVLRGGSRLPDHGSMLQLFGEKLRRLRRGHNLTQTELAVRLGIGSQSFVAHLEAGRKDPSIMLAIQIADLFGVSLDYLLRDTIPVAPTGDESVEVDEEKGEDRAP